MSKALIKTQAPKAVDYPRLKKAIAQEISSTTQILQKTFQSQLVLMYWNVGRILRQESVITDYPHQDNPVHAQQLARDFQRPRQFFYDCAKFHRLYPKAAPKHLTWSHYELLIRVRDPHKRRMLEQRAIREHLSTRKFRLLTRCPHPVKGLPKPHDQLGYERGRLYHYRSVESLACALEPGWALIDLGFNVQRAVRYPTAQALASGLIVYSVLKDKDYTIRIAAPEPSRLNTYQIKCQRIIDGDTIVACINMGFHCWSTQRLRFRGIDAPEMTCTLGQKAKAFVKQRLASSDYVIARTYRQEKYGRFLADIFYKPGSKDPGEVAQQGIFLNQELLDEGLAVVYG